MTYSNPESGRSLPESATADTHSTPPAMSAVAQHITATHRAIADAHEHGRKRTTLIDLWISRLHFAVARRLARWAWKFAVMGKRRVS